MSSRNILSMQHYILLILPHSHFAKVFARFSHICRKICNLFQHTRNVAKAQNYNSRKFGLKM